MDRATYEFAKKASRTAYEEASRTGGGGSGDGGPHTHPEYLTELPEHNHQHDHDALYASKTHDHPSHAHPYVKTDGDSNLTHTDTQRWTKWISKAPKKEDGTSDTSTEWGISIDLDEGNTYRNQFEVGTKRNGFALKVLGGENKEVWVGGSASQKGGDKSNPKDENYITRKNLNEKVWIGTQAEYDALGSKSDSTLYVVM